MRGRVAGAWRLALAFVALLVLALAARLWVLQGLSYEVLGCRWCTVPNVVQADLPLLALLAGVFWVSLASARRWWSLPWRVFAVVGLGVYAADIATMMHFGTRLMVADARVYLADWSLAAGVVSSQPWWHYLLAAAALLLLVWLIGVRAAPRLPARAVLGGVLTLGVLGMGAPAVIPVAGYVHEWALRSVVAANRPTGVATPYAEATRQRLGEQGDAPSQCVTGRAAQGPVVVVLLESWSTYHSALWSGLNDWTPRLDALAREGLHFTALHSGGFNTNEGLVSLFTGMDFVLPIKPLYRYAAFEGAWQPDTALPEQLGELGVHTALLTTGNLAFTRKGEWLEHIGFTHVEGHDYPGYSGHPRHHFDAVADELLYVRALEYLDEREAEGGPSLTVVENVSSHHPFQHPHTGERSEEAVFRYMDDTAADFIDALKDDGFLERGTLVVLSDHRAMTLIEADEKRLFGRAAASLVPGFVMGEGIEPGEVAEPFHQADLVPTLMRHFAGEHCTSQPLRDLFAPAQSEPRCVIHARGDRRNRLDVFCPEGEGTVRVAGDDSHFLSHDGLDAEARRALLARIARERLAQ